MSDPGPLAGWSPKGRVASEEVRRLIVAHAESGAWLSADELVGWHRTLFGDVDSSAAGRLRSEAVVVLGLMIASDPRLTIPPILKRAKTLAEAVVSHPQKRDEIGKLVAAQLFVNLVRAQPFVDGNKRLALFVMEWTFHRLSLSVDFDPTDPPERVMYQAVRANAPMMLAVAM